MADPALYIPTNSALDRVFVTAPRQLRPYLDHERFLLHQVCTKKWLGDLDAQGYARLAWSVLGRYIPVRRLKGILDHLIGEGVFETAGYSVGRKATGYMIAPAFDGPPRRAAIADGRLAEKMRAWREAFSKEDAAVIRPITHRRADVLAHMLMDLDRLALSGSAAEVSGALTAEGVNPEHAAYACQVIENRDHDGVKIDGFGWRCHTIATRTCRELRGRFRLTEKPLVEVDVANAQPLLLSLLLSHPEAYHHLTTPEEEGARPGRAVPLPTSLARALHDLRAGKTRLDCGEVAEFREIAGDGAIYEMLMETSGVPDRKQVKRELYRDVFFGRPHVRGRITAAFGDKWPSILAGVRFLKRQCGYKVIAQILQRLESIVMIDGVCGRLVREHPEIGFLTIHDSALVVSEKADLVRDLIVEELRRWGVRATVRRKGEP